MERMEALLYGQVIAFAGLTTHTPPGLIKVSTWVGLRPPPGQRKQRRDVMHHRLDAGSDQATPSQPRQVEGCGAQRGLSTCTIAAEAVRVLVELGVADPVPALNAPTVP